MFKNYEDYLTQRTALIGAAQAAIESGDYEASEAKSAEVEALDAEFDKFKAMQANLDALKGNAGALPVNMLGAEDVTEKVDVCENYTNSIEYRRAFMNFVGKGIAIPDKFKNEDQVTTTTDAGSLIPEMIVNRIIERLEARGMIWSRITKTSYKGGVKIPVSNVKPVASWVNEGEGSYTQKKAISGYVSFTWNKLRCAVAVTLEVDTMSLEIFEARIVENIGDAMLKQLEQSVISGTGSGQPKGILAETPNEGQALQIAAAGTIGYDTLIDMEAALPIEYEADAVFLMTKKTFMAFAGITDNAGQPIARVDHGINGRIERTLLGREVILNNYMDNYADTVAADKIVAALFNLADYTMNMNLNITMKTYEDNDTDDIIRKAVALADGKVVIKDSLVTLTKKA